MKKNVNFLFVIDVSGSMYGRKIASVNASLTECLAALKQIGHSEKYDIMVSVVTFAEKMQLHIINEKPDNIGAPHIKVEPQKDGLYRITSFGCLYKGLKLLFDNKTLSDEKQGKNTFIFLFSDAKPVDEEEYSAAYKDIQTCVGYKNATKYVGYVEENADKYNRETVRFVDYKADRIVRASELSDEIEKLQLAFLSDFNDQSEYEKNNQLSV